MNREEIFESFFELECAIQESLTSGQFNQDRILEATGFAKRAAMLASIPYQLRNEREIREIIRRGDQNWASEFVEGWLRDALRQYCPGDMSADQTLENILSLMRTIKVGRNCSELADAVASRLSVSLGLSSSSPEYFYFETIIRESLGLPGDAETKQELFTDQFVCAEMLRDLAFSKAGRDRTKAADRLRPVRNEGVSRRYA